MKLRKIKTSFYYGGGYMFRAHMRKVKPPYGYRWITGSSELVLKRRIKYE